MDHMGLSSSQVEELLRSAEHRLEESPGEPDALKIQSKTSKPIPDIPGTLKRKQINNIGPRATLESTKSIVSCSPFLWNRQVLAPIDDEMQIASDGVPRPSWVCHSPLSNDAFIS